MPRLASYLAAFGQLTGDDVDTVIGAIERDWIADRLTCADRVRLIEEARHYREVHHVAAASESSPAPC